MPSSLKTLPPQKSEKKLINEQERNQLLIDWNKTQKKYALDRCLHQLFENQVKLTPDAIAVVCENQQITYEQLNQKANIIAHTLKAKGIGQGFYVPVLMDASIDLVITLLAILKTGAAFVPIDTHWPIERLKQNLDDLNSELIIVNQLTSYKETTFSKLFFFIDGSDLSSSTLNLDINIDSNQPIYAIYTSGSTGKPKAAIVPHRGITNRFLWMNDFFGRESALSVLQTTRHVYDSAVWQLFWPLINGGKTVIPASEMEILTEQLTTLIEKYEITIIDFVPSVFNQIVPKLTNNSEIKQKLKSLHTVIIGGEKIIPSTTYKFIEYFPNVRVVNLYGPTEASIGCICYWVTGKENGKIPIGKPIANVHSLILDQQKNLVPIGVPGELYLSGICLGYGYLNNQLKRFFQL